MNKFQKQYDISFPPKEATGTGRNKVFPYTQEEWQELFEKCADIKTAYRTELCHAYHTTYLTVRKKVGDLESNTRGVVTVHTPSLTKDKDEIIADMDKKIKFYKDELAKLENSRAQIIKMDDDFLKTIAGMMVT